MIIKNALAAAILNHSSGDSEEVMEYLVRLNEIRSRDLDQDEMKDALDDFEREFTSSSRRAQVYSVVTDFVNRRPVVAVFASFTLLYNLVWGCTVLIKKFL